MKRFFCCFLVLVYNSAVLAQSNSDVVGLSRTANPAISANGLFLWTLDGVTAGEHGEEEEGHVHGAAAKEGMQVQEVELQLSSFVDPYLKANVILAMHGAAGVELEEGYVATLGLPANLNFKAGKFFADFGKHNLLHTHQFHFVNPPLVAERLLGREGLNEAGLGLSWLAPTSWYAEFSAQVINGDHEIFASPHGGDLLYLGHLKNFWDLGGASSLELGGSYAVGKNASARTSRLAGADFTYKWRPPRRGAYRSLELQAEYLYSTRYQGRHKLSEGGFYLAMQYRLARRWWIQGRYDLFGVPNVEGERDYRIGTLLALVPSEFSALRFQYSRLYAEGEGSTEIFLQFNFTIGSHPSHSY